MCDDAEITDVLHVTKWCCLRAAKIGGCALITRRYKGV
jgi:hypothetical protein